ncbi:hypothetical protein RAN53_03950 [Halomonas sp. SSL-5]|uniref:hypothetical protein n=1 Tax=Halomonas sp. SSL-5 TaxID=3065855 RepID=UPI002738E64F|nr:hypothetical protein [Halomonas sp. SSL-5]MDY7115488.1 hypothetical protein [Halomonas sp. SSL-5]
MKHLKRWVEKTHKAEQYSGRKHLSASSIYLRGHSGVLGCQVTPVPSAVSYVGMLGEKSTAGPIRGHFF